MCATFVAFLTGCVSIPRAEHVSWKGSRQYSRYIERFPIGKNAFDKIMRIVRNKSGHPIGDDEFFDSHFPLFLYQDYLFFQCLQKAQSGSVDSI